MLGNVKTKIKIKIAKNKWKKKNSHNFTTLNSICSVDRINVGKGTYGELNVYTFGNTEGKLTIGNYCSIAAGVEFMLDGEHNYKNPTTYPFKVRYWGERAEAMCRGPIVIKDDVWIGQNVMIMSGVTIGQGAVIGAGSVVRADVPPYAVYVDDRVKKYRFKKEYIDKLLKWDISSINIDEFEKNKDFMYKELDEEFFKSELYKRHLKVK